MALFEFTVENAEATATPKFVLFESAEYSTEEGESEYDTSISQPEVSGPGLGILFVLAGLAIAAWIARRWL